MLSGTWHQLLRPVPPGSVRRATGPENGFTLVEALISIFILTLVALSLGQLLGVGMLSDKAAGDTTQATTLAGAKLEELRNGDYGDLIAGGSLHNDLDNYSDSVDANSDGNDDYRRRWSIADQDGGKTVVVRTTALQDSIGPAKSVTMATVVGER